MDMTTRKNEMEVFIQVRDLGFTFLLNKRMKHNLIDPVFLSFFKEENPATDEEYQANQIAVEKLMRESEEAFPILPEHLKVYHFKNVYQEAGCEIVRCSDGKFRKCKAVKFNFEHEEQSYSELFFIDKSIKEHNAILGSSFRSKLDVKQ